MAIHLNGSRQPVWVWVGVSTLLLLAVGLATPSFAQIALPKLTIGASTPATNTSPQELSQGIQLLLLLTVLSMAPAILLMTTAFTRIIMVLSIARQAVGSAQLPPNQVLVGLALILSFFVMAPTFGTIQNQALGPYMAGKLSQEKAIETLAQPMRQFMFKQVSASDLKLFVELARLPKPKAEKDVPFYVLLPAFVISELKTAFQLGFMLFLPFMVIDVVVSSILVSMGMMFLPPASISLPFKLILFVMVDGWHLLCKALVLGFQN
jgi:flagellar biosynthesis protein FliP